MEEWKDRKMNYGPDILLFYGNFPNLKKKSIYLGSLRDVAEIGTLVGGSAVIP